MPLTRGDARFIRLPVFSRKFLLTRTMFSGLHLSLSLTVVNVSYRNYFNDLGYRLQLSCFRKSGKKSSHINLARRLFCKVTTNILNLPNFSPTFLKNFHFQNSWSMKKGCFAFASAKILHFSELTNQILKNF